MAAILRTIGPFDENTKQWNSYTERFEYFATANGITDDKMVPMFLTVMGSKAYNLL